MSSQIPHINKLAIYWWLLPLQANRGQIRVACWLLQLARTSKTISIGWAFLSQWEQLSDGHLFPFKVAVKTFETFFGTLLQTMPSVLSNSCHFCLPCWPQKLEKKLASKLSNATSRCLEQRHETAKSYLKSLLRRICSVSGLYEHWPELRWPPSRTTTYSRAALRLCLFYSLPSVCSHIKVRREPANPQPFMVRSWPAEGGWLWLTHTEGTHPEGRKHCFCRDLQVPWDSFFYISKNLQANPQGSKRFSGFFGFFLLSERNIGLSAAFELFVFRRKERGEEGAADTWHMISNPTKTTKLAVQRWQRKQLPDVGEVKKKRAGAIAEVRWKAKGGERRRLCLFGQTRVHSPEKIGHGGKHWQAAARRKDQTRRVFLAGQGWSKKVFLCPLWIQSGGSGDA